MRPAQPASTNPVVSYRGGHRLRFFNSGLYTSRLVKRGPSPFTGRGLNMNRYISCLSMLLLPLFPTASRGEEPKSRRDDAAIEKVVAESLEASRKDDWKRYAELVHPDSLQEYKDMWLPILRVATRERPEKQADMLSAFDKATDLKAVMALKPKEFLASSMKGMASQIPGLRANSTDVEEKIIGTLHDGNDRAYVVVRTRRKTDRDDLSRVEVISLKRSGNEWKLMLPDVVRIMADTFKRRRAEYAEVWSRDRSRRPGQEEIRAGPPATAGLWHHVGSR